MPTTFSANKIFYSVSFLKTIKSITFSENKEMMPSTYLFFQRDLTETEQNIKFDRFGEYIEFCHPSQATYNGVQSMQLTRDNAKIVFTHNAAVKLNETEVFVSFSISESDFELLKSTLLKIIGEQRMQFI